MLDYFKAAGFTRTCIWECVLFQAFKDCDQSDWKDQKDSKQDPDPRATLLDLFLFFEMWGSWEETFYAQQKWRNDCWQEEPGAAMTEALLQFIHHSKARRRFYESQKKSTQELNGFFQAMNVRQTVIFFELAEENEELLKFLPDFNTKMERSGAFPDDSLKNITELPSIEESRE